MIGKKKTLLLAACLLFSIFVANIPVAAVGKSDVPLTMYIHNVWQTADGLPEDAVQAIAQTPDGYLWLGTQEGMARFDGVRFVVYDRVGLNIVQYFQWDFCRITREPIEVSADSIEGKNVNF